MPRLAQRTLMKVAASALGAGLLSACAANPPAPPPPAAAVEMPHSPVLPHIANAEIADYYFASFDVARIPVAPIPESREASPDNVVALQAALTQHVYRLPEGLSKAHALAFYRNVLRNEGFEILWTCRGIASCGAGFAHYVHHGGPVLARDIDYAGYTPFGALTGRRFEIGGGETFVFIYTGEHDRRRLFQEVVTTGSIVLR